MAGALGTQATWTLDSISQGNVRLRRIKESKTSDGSSTTAENAVGEDDPVGFKDKPGPKTITLEVYEEQGAAECNWQLLKDTKEVFSLTKQIVGGRRVQYPVCRVSKIDPSNDSDGGQMFSVEVVALKEKTL